MPKGMSLLFAGDGGWTVGAIAVCHVYHHSDAVPGVLLPQDIGYLYGIGIAVMLFEAR